MNISKSFDETLKKYRITGSALSKKVGISPSHISQFRNGKGGSVAHTTLEEMLNAMEEIAPGSKLYFCQLLVEKPLETGTTQNLVELIDAASDEEMEAAMQAIGRKWTKIRQQMYISNKYTTEVDPAIAV